MKEFVKFILNKTALAIANLFSFPLPAKRRGILLIRTDNIGDLLLFLPALEALIVRYAPEPMTLIVSEAAAELAEGLRLRGLRIAQLIVVDRHAFNFNFFYKCSLLIRLRKSGYSLSLVPAVSRDVIADTLCAATAAPQCIAWRRIGQRLPAVLAGSYDGAYTQLSDCPESVTKEYERNALFARELGAAINEADVLPRLKLLPEDYEASARLQSRYALKKGAYAVLTPGAGASYRVWSASRYAAVAAHLDSVGYTVVISASAAEKKIAEAIRACSSVPLVDLSGQTPLFVLAALLADAALYVGNETGTLHLAAAVGAPIVCLMGGGHYGRFFPYTDNPLQKAVSNIPAACLNDDWDCGRRLPAGVMAPCIESIDPEMVITKIEELRLTLAQQ